jgi:small subunit ribosomal protein S9
MKNQTVTTGKYTYAKGRRKTAVAGARIFEGKGEILVNDKPFKEYFPLEMDRNIIMEPLKTVEMNDKFYFTLRIVGGGVKGQRGAAVHALARALVKFNEELKPALKAKGFMTRDDRMVERKHTGFVKARKSPQYSKR